MVLMVLLVLGGLGLLLAAVISHRREQDLRMTEVLGLVLTPAGEEHDEALSAVTTKAVDLAGQAIRRMDSARSLDALLERAKIPLRPGEFVIVVVAGALSIAAAVTVAFGSVLFAAAAAVLAVLVVARLLRRRVAKRRKAFEAQLPDALSLVASSLSAGHTFLRAVQMMCEESAPPLSEEFARLVAETRLGDSVTDALQRMALRLQIRDLDMVVQAIRIQQTVGGRMADLFHTLADVIRARNEVKREVLILTAEGRMSAYVLAGLVPCLFAMMSVLNPDYVEPLHHGTGLIVLSACAVSVVAGLFVILRMVRIDV